MFILCGVMLTNGIILDITPFQFTLASGLLAEKNALNRFLEKWLFPEKTDMPLQLKIPTTWESCAFGL